MTIKCANCGQTYSNLQDMLAKCTMQHLATQQLAIDGQVADERRYAADMAQYKGFYLDGE